MHQSAPLTVQVRRGTKIGDIVFAKCDGAIVSGQYSIHKKDARWSLDVQWARAFLDGVRNAPEVVGVRS